MTPDQLALYIGILIGCLLVTIIPYARKKYVCNTVEHFDVDYAITMLISFIVSVVASMFIYEGAGVPVGDSFDVFIEGIKLGFFDNYWINEVKKYLNN